VFSNSIQLLGNYKISLLSDVTPMLKLGSEFEPDAPQLFLVQPYD